MGLLLKAYDVGAMIAFCSMFMCIIVEVISRNILFLPTTWAEELSRFFCVWAVFLGAASAWRRGAHIAILALTSRLTGRWRLCSNIFVEAVSLTFLGAAWLGTMWIMGESYSNTTTALEMSVSFFYLGVFLGISGMIVFSMDRIYKSCGLAKRDPRGPA